MSAHLVWVEVFARSSDDLSHEGGVLDVFIVAEHVNGVLTRLCGPVAHITGSVPFVITFYLRLRWTLNREPCKRTMMKIFILPTQT